MMARITNYLLFCLILLISASTPIVHCQLGQPSNGHTVLQGVFTPPPPSPAQSPSFVYPTNEAQTSQNAVPLNSQSQILSPVNTATNFIVNPAPPSSSIAASVLNLSQKILTSILKENQQQKHMVVSPTSISAALSLVLLGARGETYRELMNVLQLPSGRSTCELHEQFGALLSEMVASNEVLSRKKTNTDDIDDDDDYYDNEPREHKISVANALFVQQNFNIRPDYKSAVQNVYHSSIKDVDYLQAPADAANLINSWVARETNGKIKQIVSNSISPDTRMIIASALYFKAEWRKMFIEGANMIRKFYPDGKSEGKHNEGRHHEGRHHEGRSETKNDTSYPVEMMAHGGIFPFYQSEELQCRIMGFTYAHGQSTMYIIMPNHSDRTKLMQLQQTLTAEKIEEMIASMKNNTAVVLFPKMQLSSEVKLERVFRSLGLHALFDSRQSDLSLISNGQSLGNIAFPDSAEYIKTTSKKRKRDVKYKVESSVKRTSEPLNLKDLVLRKRISKKNPGKKTAIRHRRQTSCQRNELSNLDKQRSENFPNPALFASQIAHKVELAINERGTEGGAATAITLNRSGTKVVFRVDGPFLLLIRHELTKLPLFYGAILEPPGVNES